MLDIKTTFYSTFFFLLLLQYRRLLDVIHSNSVALSGSKFFYVTKGMILTVSLKAHNREKIEESSCKNFNYVLLIFQLAGTILTYELVLLQQIEDIAEQDNITTTACGVILQ